MVALFSIAADYEFVIWLFGRQRTGFPESVPWSAT